MKSIREEYYDMAARRFAEIAEQWHAEGVVNIRVEPMEGLQPGLRLVGDKIETRADTAA